MSTSAIQSFTPGAHGELAGSLTAKEVAGAITVPGAKMIRFKHLGVASNIHLGMSNAVAVPNGTDNQVAGWSLAPGDESPWLPCHDDGDPWWFICEDAADDLGFLILT